MSAVTVRLAEEADSATIARLIRELAVYEELEHELKAGEADIRREGFGPHPRFECLIAEEPGPPAEALGFALFFHNFSTFEGCAGLYCEDLFVVERARGRGVGRRLVTRLAGLAVERGCARLDLSVLDWNPARDFYHRIGFRHLRQWLPYRLDGEALQSLAERAED